MSESGPIKALRRTALFIKLVALAWIVLLGFQVHFLLQVRGLLP